MESPRHTSQFSNHRGVELTGISVRKVFSFRKPGSRFPEQRLLHEITTMNFTSHRRPLVERNIYAHSDEICGSILAAKAVVPIVCEIIGTPDSIVDLGGGTGAWSKAFKDFGVNKIRCIDHPSAAADGLLIEIDEFIAKDLACDKLSPICSDLAISVEVLEHLPEARSAALVDFLTSSAPIVLFSAAIPGQQGVHHVNEQFRWYWSELFLSRGFEERDCIRKGILFNENIPFWYRQNLTLFVDTRKVNSIPIAHFLPNDFELVHREVLARLAGPRRLRRTVAELFPSMWRAIKFRLPPT